MSGLLKSKMPGLKNFAEYQQGIFIGGSPRFTSLRAFENEVKVIVNEIWKDIIGFKGIYQISAHGQIRRFWPNTQLGYKILNPWTDRKTGYQRIDLCINGSTITRTVHQLVLETFVGPRFNKMEGRHLDGNKLNNKIDNLMWGTKSENQKDRKRHGNPSIGGNFKLMYQQISNIRQLLKSGRNGSDGPKYSHRAIAIMFGVSRSTITDINIGRNWKGK